MSEEEFRLTFLVCERDHAVIAIHVEKAPGKRGLSFVERFAMVYVVGGIGPELATLYAVELKANTVSPVGTTGFVVTRLAWDPATDALRLYDQSSK